MLHREKAIAALEKKADQLKDYELRKTEIYEAYRLELDELGQLDQAELDLRLDGIDWPGARPTLEQDQYDRVIVPFGQDWNSHQQARSWAREVLEGVSTIAVDGSQITSSKTISVPVGAVQVGWFINPHSKEAVYTKDISFEVFSPDELNEVEGDSVFPDWRINMERFKGECIQAAALMEKFSKEKNTPICFFDGSLIVSFVQHMKPSHQRMYVQAILDLLETSRKFKVPLVGYVDTSYAKDLASMMDLSKGRKPQNEISDGAILDSKMVWGDRSISYVCARDDKVLPTDGNKYYQHLIIVYLKTTSDRHPVRLELPRWVLDEGLLEYVLDIVRAECVVGNGYPYGLETADAVAVLTHQDQDRFYRLVQEFAQKEKISLRFSRKAVSKRGRRA